MNDFKGLQTSYGDGNVFFITFFDGKYRLHVEPEYRHNGTQNLDGYYPRDFKTIGAAKASLTNFLGKPARWSEINS